MNSSNPLTDPGGPKILILRPEAYHAGMKWVAIGTGMVAAVAASGKEFGGAVVLAAIASIGALGMIYLRLTTVLDSRETGIRLYRGAKVKREIPWDRVRKVSFAWERSDLFLAGYTIRVVGDRMWRRITVATAGYAVPEADVVDAGKRTCEIAASFAIPYTFDRSKPPA